jgi:hypothetical protein
MNTADRMYVSADELADSTVESVLVRRTRSQSISGDINAVCCLFDIWFIFFFYLFLASTGIITRTVAKCSKYVVTHAENQR